MEGQTSLTPPQSESQRTSRKVLLVAVAGVLMVALGVGGYLAYAAWDRGRDAQTAVTRASSLLESAEADLLTVDEAVQVEISSVTATQAVAASALAEDVRERVLEASDIIADSVSDLPEDQLDLALAIKDSADARAEMMAIAPAILEADRTAAEAISYADQAVAEIKAAEELSAQAAGEFNKHTGDGVRAADALYTQAEGRLGSAASLLTSATVSFPDADFAPFQEYVSAKLGLVALAKDIDATWLAGDIAGSNAKLAAYNQRDAEIVAMAKALPASVRDPIANAYEALTADDLAKYFDARERARQAGVRADELRDRSR